MKTFLGKDIPEDVRGILYLCYLDEDSIQVLREIMFTDAGLALNAYANIPNPESQLVTAESYDHLKGQLITLHACLRDKDWCIYQHEFI